ncbi:LysR family transcriptional regulator [Pseudoglutamicibacter cumminsii]|uniref:LysR family transcriptional regulator n=1 Tax=Pseudoglutamicibacter cumminsii TaxID=156979 RepID=UPI002552B71B|nr:LysR family transcriptional regulator [Pseudoglutamicibacter cumminsii]MDK7083328.1 LysR family transcriptional regulator [Pseudoglutamicibacter cumminsii]
MNLSDMGRVNLNLLVTFQTLMDAGSVTATARRLQLTQSAVSASLSKLRTLFNDPLFVRTQKGMSPTRRALEISTRLGPSLATIESVLFHPREFNPAESKKTFHISASDDIELILAPWLAQKRLEMGWQVEFAFHQTSAELWTGEHRHDSADLVITAAPPIPPENYHRDPLFTGGYACLYDPKFFNGTKKITLEEYASAPHVRVSFNTQIGWVDGVLQSKGYLRNVILSTTHFAGLAALLPRVPAIATIPKYAAEAMASSAGLCTCKPPFEAPQFTISMLWQTQYDSAPENAWLRTLVRGFTATVNA